MHRVLSMLSQFREKNLVLPLPNSSFFDTSKEYNNVATPNYPFYSLLSTKWSLTQKKILRDVVAKKRFQI